MAAERTPIRCPRCGRIIGESDGPRLYIGGGIARRLITLGCAGRMLDGRAVPCRGVVIWKPSEVPEAHYNAALVTANR